MNKLKVKSMGKNGVSFLFAMLTIIACQTSDKTSRQGEPDIYSLKSEDTEMNDAIDESRLTFDTFLKALENQNDSQSSFSVKVPFEVEGGHEHIWLGDIRLQDGRIFGVINNVPDQVANIDLGDEVEIDPKTISDWFYIEGNKLIGGLTIRVLRNRMTTDEQAQFDQEFGVEF